MTSPQRSSSHTRDLTTGPIFQNLLLFAFPLLGSSLIQQLYNSVDLIFVGNLIGKEASAAVGSGALLIATLVDFFIGLGVGVNILCARAFGAKDYSKLCRLIHTSFVLSVVSSLLLTVLGWFTVPAVLRWYQTPEAIFPMAVSYMRVYFLSLLSVITFNISYGILRALGDSRSPMICQLLGGFANIFGDFLFIYVLRLGVVGAALATMLSQTVAMLLTLRLIFRLPEEYRLTLHSLDFSLSELLHILLVGIPTAVQSMVITFSNLVIQTQINMLGVDSMAAYTAFYKVDAIAYLPLGSIGQAMVTYVGQNLGAKKPDRIRKGILTGMGMSMIVSLIIGGAISFAYYPFYRVFVADDTVIQIGGGIAHSAFLYYFLYSYSEVLSSSLRGAGKTFISMAITLLCVVAIRIPIIFWLYHTFHSAPGMALIYPITWTIASICFTFAYRWHRRDLYA